MISNNMEKLVLFDIDGTLIDSLGIGRDAITKAIYDIFSIEDAFHNINMDGKTDIQIIKSALKKHHLSSENGVIPAVLSRYMQHLETGINTGEVRLHPGVIELLEFLHRHRGFQLGLLTGNIEQGGRKKIAPFDLNPYFPFGAFGNDNEDRNKLLPIAVERFGRLPNRKINFRDCVVVGDTPLDVKCSKPYGACSIAVATGLFSRKKLLRTQADYVLDDLSEACELDIFR